MGAAISSMCGLADDEKQLIAGLARRGTAYKDEGNLKQDIFDALIHLASMDEYACVPQFVEIGVRCSNLPREDRFSLSDPMVIIYEKSAGSIWREQGRTELIMNNLNPVFLQHIQVMVRPGQDQQLMVKVIDLDGDVDERFVEAEHCTSLATVECSMEALLSTVGNKDKCLVLPDNPEQTANHLCVALYAEYVSRPRGRVDCKFSALHIHVDEKTSTDGKPALLYEILREVPPANSAPEGTPSRYVRVYKSEMSSSNDPDWLLTDLDEASLDNGDPNIKFLINVLNFQSDGSYRLMGSTKMTAKEAASHALTGKEIPLAGAITKQATLGRLMRKSIQKSLQRVSGSGNPLSKASHLNPISKKSYERSINSPKPESSIASFTNKITNSMYGNKLLKADSKLSRVSSLQKVSVPSIRIEKWEVKPRASMVNFLRAGAELKFVVAIDMTKDNKHPDKRGSLHFLLGHQGPSAITRYEEVLIRIQRLMMGKSLNRTMTISQQSFQSTVASQLSDLSNHPGSRRIQNQNDPRSSSMQIRTRGSTSLDPERPATKIPSAVGSMAPLNFASSMQLSARMRPSGFNVYGFGANKPGLPPSHIFPFTQRGLCNDVGDFSRSYRHALTKWRLSGPRHFAPLIEEACALADREVDKEIAMSAAIIAHESYSDPLTNEGIREVMPAQLPPAYTVLFLLTCGPPEDLMETLDALERASSLPLSVVVIDVNEMELGNDFRLRLLDERGRTTEEMRQMYTFLAHLNGKKPERSNVHFVQYRRHPLMGEIADEELMLDLISSIPAQYLEYCRAKGFEVPQGSDFAFSQQQALNEMAILEGDEHA